MEKTEFKQLIEKAEADLICGKKKFVCTALRRLYCNGKAGAAFSKMFSPRTIEDNIRLEGIDGLFNCWLGENCKENLPRRLFFLRMFERVCLDEKLYLNF